FVFVLYFFFSSRRRHTRFSRDWSSDVCSSDLFLALLNNRLELQALSPIYRQPFVLYSRLRWPALRDCRPKQRLTGGQPTAYTHRSEERRVGKECRARRSTDEYKKQVDNSKVGQ